MLRHGPHKIDRDRETKAGESAAAAENRGIDADHAAVRVEQRSAGIAGIDRRIGLDEILKRPETDTAAQRADDPAADRLADAEGIADRQHHVANLELVAVAKRGGRKAGGLDLEDREVGKRVSADHLGFVALVRFADGNAHIIRALDHVVVGENVAVGGDDDAGAETFLRLLGRPAA